ncbi:sodium-dependent phosphate transport protein 2A-like [Babylonia areolata]|uniref:sodium-dependent phosphate transport protein 2A-like n=1 Tax=Babylonia areolata TaxID=304850 RepID=UPI003FD66BBA
MATPGGNMNGQQGSEDRINTDRENRPVGAYNTGDWTEEDTHVDLGLPPEQTELEKMAMFLKAQMDEDEGCVIDMTEARTYGRYPLTSEDNLPPASKLRGFPSGGLPNDSGFSSRMSEDSASLHRAVEVSELKKAVADVAQGGDESADVADTQGCCRLSSVVKGLMKLLMVILLLYVFICSLDLLSNAFRLLGGKTAGSVFQDSELLKNPITGLMIGVMATVILQSSSTSTSIVITMVSSGILEVRPAIPIVMGANIGTTVTNTLVSLAHSMDPKEFRRAFSGATVHDVFNWLTVVILLPIEHFTGYLYFLTLEIVQSLNMEELRTKKQDLLKQLTKPLTKRIVQVDKKVITAIAEGKGDPNARLLKVFCVFNKTETMMTVNRTLEDGNVTLVNETVVVKTPVEACDSLLSKLDMGDSTSGLVLFIFSLLLLSGCLYLMVKVLHSLLGSQVARMAKKTINANFPGPFACLTDYFALVVGAGMTILVQSSSVFTSALTPLVGVGCLKLERMYPLTLGSNVGTTGTGILAALASSSSTIQFALQLALCHLFFNITGILLFFPIPPMRRFPLRVARFLGRTTARYRWFAVFYLLLMFLVFPGFFMALSFAGNVVFITTLCVVGVLVAAIIILNCMQRHQRLQSWLPLVLRDWEWLPLPLRSLQPLDRLFCAMCAPFKRICCECCLKRCRCLGDGADAAETSSDMDSDDDDSDDEEDNDTDNASSSCCCPRSRGMQRIQQSDSLAAVEGGQGSVWQKRTNRPIYKLAQKAQPVHPSPSTVPLIRIPESVV